MEPFNLKKNGNESPNNSITNSHSGKKISDKPFVYKKNDVAATNRIQQEIKNVIESTVTEFRNSLQAELSKQKKSRYTSKEKTIQNETDSSSQTDCQDSTRMRSIKHIQMMKQEDKDHGAAFEKYANSLQQSQQAILQLTTTVGDLVKSQRLISASEQTSNKSATGLGPNAPVFVVEDKCIKEESSSSSNESLLEEVKKMRFEVENYQKADNCSFVRKKERKNRRKLALHSQLNNLREELSKLKRKNEEEEIRSGFEYRENASKMAEEVRNLKFHHSFETALKEIKDRFQVQTQLNESESKQKEIKIKTLEKQLQDTQLYLENLKIENRNIPKLREDKVNLLAKVNEQKDLIENLRGMVEGQINLASQNGEIGSLLAEEKSKLAKTEYELRRLRRELVKCNEKNLKLESEVAPKVCVLTEEKLALEGELNTLRYSYLNLEKEFNIIRTQKEEVLRRNVMLKNECRMYKKEANDLKEGEMSSLNETNNTLFYAKRRLETELIECKTKLNEAVDSLEAAYKHIEIQSSQIASFSEAPSSLTVQYLSEACKKLSLLESQIIGHKLVSERQVESSVNREAQLSNKQHSTQRRDAFQRSSIRVPLRKSPLVPSGEKLDTHFSSEATSSDVESMVSYRKAQRKVSHREMPKIIVQDKLMESELSSSEFDLVLDHINMTTTNAGQAHTVKLLKSSSSERKSKKLNLLTSKGDSSFKFRTSLLPLKKPLSDYITSSSLPSSSKKSSYEASDVKIFQKNEGNSIVDSRSDDSSYKKLSRFKNGSTFQNLTEYQENSFLNERKSVSIHPISNGAESGSKILEEPSFPKIHQPLIEPREDPLRLAIDIPHLLRKDFVDSSHKSLASLSPLENACVNSAASNPPASHGVSEEKINSSGVKDNNLVVDSRSDNSYRRKRQINNLSLFENSAECLPETFVQLDRISKLVPKLSNATTSTTMAHERKKLPKDDHPLNKPDKILLEADIGTPHRSEKDRAILNTSTNVSAVANEKLAILCNDSMGENREKKNNKSVNESIRQELNCMDDSFSPRVNINAVQVLSMAALSQCDRTALSQNDGKPVYETENAVTTISTSEMEQCKPSPPSQTQPSLGPQEEIEEQEVSHHPEFELLTVHDTEQVQLLSRPPFLKGSYVDEMRKAPPVEIEVTGKPNTSNSHAQCVCPVEDTMTSDRKMFGYPVVQEGPIERDSYENYSSKRFVADQNPEITYTESLKDSPDFSGGHLNDTEKKEKLLLNTEIEQRSKTAAQLEDISDSVTLDGPPLIKALADSIKATNFESFDIVKQSNPDTILKNLARKLPLTFETDDSISSDFPEFNPALLAALKSGISEPPEYENSAPVSFSDSLSRHKDLTNSGTGDSYALRDRCSVSVKEGAKFKPSPVDNIKNGSRTLYEKGIDGMTTKLITLENIIDGSEAVLSNVQNCNTVNKAEKNMEQISIPENSSSINLSKRSSDDDSFWN